MKCRGYFGIGIEAGKFSCNYGTLFRSAIIMGASFVFIIKSRFKKQHSDTLKSHRHMPTYDYKDLDEFTSNMPHDCSLVGVEMVRGAIKLSTFNHPQRACYLLGSEDSGLSALALRECDDLVKIPGDLSLNVAVAGSIVMYDRMSKY